MVQTPAFQTTGRRRRSDRGSATPVVAALLVIGIVAAAGVGRVGEAAIARARADATADLVALASVTSGRSGAGSVAGADGAELVAIDTVGDVTVVVIERSGVRSTAAARPG